MFHTSKSVALLGLAVLILCCSCTNGHLMEPPAILPANSSPTPNVQSAENTPEPIREPAPIAPITIITCMDPIPSMPTLLPAQGGKLLVCWADYVAMTTHLRLADVEKDMILASLDLDGCMDLLPETFTDGSFVLRDAAHSQWVFLDAQLEQTAVFGAESMDGFFSHDKDRFYSLQDHILYCTDTHSGQTQPLTLPFDLRFQQITGFHPTENTIALHVYTSPFGTDCGTAILQLDSHSFSMLQSTYYQTTFGNTQTTFLRFDDEAMQYEATYCKDDAAKYLPAALFAQLDEIVPVSGSDYLVGVGASTKLFRLSDGAEVCSLAQNGVDGKLWNPCWLPQHHMLAGSVWQGSSAALYVICPEQLSFIPLDAVQNVESPLSVDRTISETYWGKLLGCSLPENTMRMRALADRIEDTYHVQILLSDQCRELAQYSNYDLVLTSAMDETEEWKRTGYFLGALEYCLSMYPEGFFDQFRSGAKDGGICFMPVEHIVSDKGYIGLCYGYVDWHAVAIDVREDDLVGPICHEIWHAIENQIVRENFGLFAEDDWAQYNPIGFCYEETMDLTDVHPAQWTLFDCTEEAYFIDEYARTNSREDRARLMEYVMTKPEFHDQLAASGALMAKLQCMCAAINQSFDTTGWDTAPWYAVANGP